MEAPALLVTVTSSTFSPSSKVTESPELISTELNSRETVKLSSAVAETSADSSEVLAVYSVTFALNEGERANEPIVSPERFGFKGLLCQMRK